MESWNYHDQEKLIYRIKGQKQRFDQKRHILMNIDIKILLNIPHYHVSLSYYMTYKYIIWNYSYITYYNSTINILKASAACLIVLMHNWHAKQKVSEN